MHPSASRFGGLLTPLSAHRTLLLLVLAGCLPAYAQQPKGELQLNTDAVKMIRFDFAPPTDNEYRKLKEAPIDKNFMKFKSDLRMPRSLTDTAKVNRPESYVRAEPYTIWTRFGEDPIYDVLPYTTKKWEIHWTLRPFLRKTSTDGVRPSTGEAYESATSSAGVGAGIHFDADRMLYESLTKRGRAIRRNRKNATAWKTYASYLPTLADSLKFPTYTRQAAIATQQTTAAPSAPAATATDSLRQAAPTSGRKKQAQAAKDIPVSDFARYIREQQQADSLRRQEFLRRDKANPNVYETEQQTRALRRQMD